MRQMDLVFAWVFGVLGACAIVGVMCGAWWHWFTAVMCVLLAWMLAAEAKREKK